MHLLFRAMPLLLALAVLGAPAPKATGEEERRDVQLSGTGELNAAGDVRALIRMVFPEDLFKELKARSRNPQGFLRDFAGKRHDAEMTDTSARIDDEKRELVLHMTQRGAVINRGQGRWSFDLGESGARFLRFDTLGDRRAMFMVEQGTWPNGKTYGGETTYLLPRGAMDEQFDQTSLTLNYRLPAPDPGDGPPVLETTLRTKPRLMTATYKVYGLAERFGGQWIAKMVFKNEGKSIIRKLRVRFRLAGYSEWGLWHKTRELVPGQTVVQTYYPVLEERIARLSSNTPANIEVEWVYEDDTGKRHTDSDGHRIVLLGVHEFVFSDLPAAERFGTWQENFNNVPLLAAWVSRDDMVVKHFAALANKRAGGVGAGTDKASTIRVLRAIYELMQVNNFTYQHPPTAADQSVSFDVQQVQNVKFPRDVIRDRSGTCIDLAILYAAAANNLGIPSYLAVVPGHCFPIFLFPDGTPLAVESTGVGGGLRYGSAPFDRMFAVGNQEMEHWHRDGRYLVVDVRDLWTKGVSNPELPELQADILQRWGIREGGAVTPQSKPNTPEAPGIPPGHPGAQPAADASAFLGLWRTMVSETTEGGQTFTYPLHLGIRQGEDGAIEIGMKIDAQVPSPGGSTLVEIRERFEAVLNAGQLIGKGVKKRLVAGGKEKQSQLDQIRLRSEGKMLSGSYGPDGTGTTMRLERVPDDEVPAPDTPHPQQPTPAQPAPTPTPTPTPAPHLPAVQQQLMGTWSGILEERLQDGSMMRVPMQLVISAEGSGRFKIHKLIQGPITMNGQRAQLRVEEVYRARIEGGQLQGQGQQKSVTLNGIEQRITLDQIHARIAGGMLTGSFSNATDGTNPFRLSRGAAAPTPAPATVQDPYVGRWVGQVTELINGEKITYPMHVEVAQHGEGSYRFIVRAQVVLSGQGGQQRVALQQTMQGRTQADGSLILTGTQKTMTTAAGSHSAPVDNGVAAVRQGTLHVRAGQTPDQQVDYQLQRVR